MTSPDGTTRTSMDAPQTGGWYSVAYGNGIFVSVSNEETEEIEN
jgi:hypothetical protein